MVANAIRDCSHRKGIVLDAFVGSGAALIAAEKTGRRGYGIEIDPAYCDVTIRRLRAACGLEAVLARISHRIKRIGAPNQRKLFCENDFLMIRGEPRCRQSVSRICLDLKPLKAAK